MYLEGSFPETASITPYPTYRHGFHPQNTNQPWIAIALCMLTATDFDVKVYTRGWGGEEFCKKLYKQVLLVCHILSISNRYYQEASWWNQDQSSVSVPKDSRLLRKLFASAGYVSWWRWEFFVFNIPSEMKNSPSNVSSRMAQKFQIQTLQEEEDPPWKETKKCPLGFVSGITKSGKEIPLKNI